MNSASSGHGTPKNNKVTPIESPRSFEQGLRPGFCPECGAPITGEYCAVCGAKAQPGRITVHSLLHEIFHYFTHLDKGFGYTLKELFRHPGDMQRSYVEGQRSRHQKPFSMFFLCGTLSGVALYAINALHARINGGNSANEADFFRHYFILLQAVLSPLYALFTWLVYYRSGRNYAEVLVLILYLLAPTFLIIALFALPKLVFTNYEADYLELAFLLIYNPLTNWRFFRGKLWVNLLQSAVVVVGCYELSQVVSKIFQGLIH